MEFTLSPMMIALKFLPASFNLFMPKLKPLLDSFTGLAKPGEMVLVLGRPGSGCSTFLKTISGKRGEYLGVNGDVHYSGIEAKEFLKIYKGEAVYDPEEDLHYATLIVGQTIRFALNTKTPGKRLPNQSKADFVECARVPMFRRRCVRQFDAWTRCVHRIGLRQVPLHNDGYFRDDNLRLHLSSWRRYLRPIRQSTRDRPRSSSLLRSCQRSPAIVH